ncbi:hypothetical protein FRC09_002747 [Ceratobasidium sp. 395]|nr:hypothetical protein FRC09_002747 [Ceratobasidium sp. 395]
MQASSQHDYIANQSQIPNTRLDDTYQNTRGASAPIQSTTPVIQPLEYTPVPPLPFHTSYATPDTSYLTQPFDTTAALDPGRLDPSQPMLSFGAWDTLGPDSNPFCNPWARDSFRTAWNTPADQIYVNPPIAPPTLIAPPEPAVPVRENPAIPSTSNEPYDPNEPYIRILSEGRVIYRHPTAGQSFGKGRTQWEIERERNNVLRGGSVWAMWNSQDEWETVRWMATTKVSQSSLNDLLKTKRYKDAGYSFKNVKRLFKKIRDEMSGFGGPEWYSEDILLSHTHKDDRVTLFFRDIEKCADFLFSRPWFAGKMAFAPEKHYNSEETDRLYENPWTADYWNDRQKTLPRGTTFGGMIIASDATPLSTHSGDVAAHAVYISLANIDKSVRAKTSENAWILVAYIPKSKFQRTMATLEKRPKAVKSKILGMLNRRLFHRCMDIITRPLRRSSPHNVIDPEGNIRSVLYELIGYVADLEEQWMLAGLGGQTCPHCKCDPTHLGDAECAPPRTRQGILDLLKKIKEDYKTKWSRSPSLEEYSNLATEHHLNGVDKPFWENIPGLDIGKVLCPDLLHGFHKLFFDHIYRFNLTGMGKPEYDARVQSQVHFSGDRAFLRGVSHISQMSGVEHRMLERQHLCIVADAPGKINEEVTRATRAAMDCIYLAQLPTQSDRTLEAYRVAHDELMKERWGWVRNGTRRGKKVVIPHFNIPKMHVIRHLDDHIRQKGSADNYSTETMEHLHIDVKDAYRASNRREWKKQTTQWLTRRERIRDFEAWMAWCRAEAEREAAYTRACLTARERAAPAEEVDEVDSETTSVRSSQTKNTNASEEESVEEQPSERDQCEYGEQLNDESSHSEIEECEQTSGEVGESEMVGEDEGEGEGEGESAGELGGVGWSMNLDMGNRPTNSTYLNVEKPGENGKVRGWLLQQANVNAEVVGENNRKRKRPAAEEPGTSRYQPRPRMQDTHGISDLQKINRDPSVRRKSIQDVCRQYNLDLEQMLHEIKRSPHLNNQPTAVDQHTYIDTWYALRLHARPPKHGHTSKMQRIRSKPSQPSHAAQSDPILYVSSNDTPTTTAKLRDCSVGQIRLIFRLAPTILIPKPPLMAFVHTFTKISRSANRTTGLLTVSKTIGRWKHRIILASEVVRSCPLAPVMRGAALRDVNRDNVLERYSDFYLNKYRSVDDFIFMYSDML